MSDVTAGAILWVPCRVIDAHDAGAVHVLLPGGQTATLRGSDMESAALPHSRITTVAATASKKSCDDYAAEFARYATVLGGNPADYAKMKIH